MGAFRQIGLGSLGLAALASAPYAWAAPAAPSGAAASLESLRQSYLDAVKARHPEAIEAMFDLSGYSPAERAGFRQQVIEDKIKEGVVQATIIDLDPHLMAEFASSGAHFSRPVVKLLKINLSVPKGQELSTTYGIATQAGRYFFVPLR